MDAALVSRLEGQVLGWLKEEGYESRVAPAAPGLFWHLSFRMQDTTLAVRAPAEKPYFMVQARISLAPDQQAAYEALSPDARTAFHHALLDEHEDGIADVGLELQPASFGLDITITRVLYPEDLTRQFFMDCCRSTQHVAAALSRLARTRLARPSAAGVAR